MNEPVCRVKKVVFGEGAPKICVPLVALDKIELEAQAKMLKMVPCDVVEWRADYYPFLTSREQVQDAFRILRENLQDRLILFTFRTKAEGGMRSVTVDEYMYLNRLVLLYGRPDLLDVELSAGEKAISVLLDKVHRKGVKVILSFHDFHRTPPVVDMVSALRKMQDLGADMCKLAVMPRSRTDVLALLQATSDMYERYATKPLITMSMGKLGAISRVCGEVFGSCMTFGCMDRPSAPGQIDALNLSMMLQIIDRDCIGFTFRGAASFQKLLEGDAPSLKDLEERATVHAGKEDTLKPAEENQNTPEDNPSISAEENPDSAPEGKN